jgi:integrase
MPTLTEAHIRASKGKDRPYKLFDERGLFMLVTPTGSHLWRFRYRYSGSEKLLALGMHPDVSLKRAREKRDDARRLLADGIDPSAQRQAEKLALGNTLEAVAREWLSLQEKSLTEGTLRRERDRLEDFVFPYIGNRPVAQITALDLLGPLRKIEARGTHETAHRTLSVCSRIFRFAVVTGRAERDVSVDLRGALAPAVTRNFPAITEPARIGELLRAIDGYIGQPATGAALKLAPYVFVRPGELRQAQWSEFDLDAAEWRIPAERMKSREPHLVPLSTQAVEILRSLHPISGRGRFVFPSLRSSARAISNNTINAGLRRLGYGKDEMTGHGFRSMASTCLNEQGWHPDLIELQLAHADRNQVRAIYNRAQRLAERKAMMQAWGDYLDTLRTGANVVPIRRTA